MKKITTLLIVMSCASPKRDNPTVSISGNLRSIMMENNTHATIRLDSLAEAKHLYALGAVADLNGEILIWDSHPIVTRVDADTTSSAHDFSAGAALLIYTSVSDWKEILVESAKSIKDLEDMLRKLSIDEDLQQPFPFIIKSSEANVGGHVVVGNEDHAHDSSYKVRSENEEIEILGFYSDHHQGVFTHHDSNVHMHFKNTASTFNAHVDELQLNGKSVILLPKSL